MKNTLISLNLNFYIIFCYKYLKIGIIIHYYHIFLILVINIKIFFSFEFELIDNHFEFIIFKGRNMSTANKLKLHIYQAFQIIFNSYEIEKAIQYLRDVNILPSDPLCTNDNCLTRLSLIKSSNSMDK